MEKDAVELPNRRPCETHTIQTPLGRISITVGWHKGRPAEIFLTQRGKAGTVLEEVLYEIGVTASKMMQGE